MANWVQYSGKLNQTKCDHSFLKSPAIHSQNWGKNYRIYLKNLMENVGFGRIATRDLKFRNIFCGGTNGGPCGCGEQFEIYGLP